MSYLSMIETGKRVPSQDVIELLAEVFQRDVDWFLDGTPDVEAAEGADMAEAGVLLEPAGEQRLRSRPTFNCASGRSVS